MKSVLSYIQDHSSEKILLPDPAGICHMNTQYFCRFFRKAAGTSPMAHVTDVRLKKAAGLLEETDLPVNEIAGRCGFSGSVYFIARFREKYGQTPGDYRKTAGNPGFSVL